MTLATYTPSLLPALVRFWNRAFAAKRNFFPVTEELFHRRVTGRRGGPERFDPRGLVLAREGGDVVGMVHSGVRSEAQCRGLDPRWPGGKQGVIYFLAVEPSRRNRGLGGELWHRALGAFRSIRQVVLDGQCVNPFYGNSEGPFTPFWGTPEGVGVEWRDGGTLKFLARKGFAPRFRAIHLARDLAPTAGLEAARRALGRQGFELEILESEFPELGGTRSARRTIPRGLQYEAAAAIRKGRVIGTIVTYPMREVRAGLYGIYETEVLEAHRGKAVGRHLLEAAVARMAAAGGTSCEVLTVSELSPAALKFYQAAGFQAAASWAIY